MKCCVDSMGTLLLHESVKQDVRRKRPTAIPCPEHVLLAGPCAKDAES